MLNLIEKSLNNVTANDAQAAAHHSVSLSTETLCVAFGNIC